MQYQISAHKKEEEVERVEMEDLTIRLQGSSDENPEIDQIQAKSPSGEGRRLKWRRTKPPSGEG